MKIKYCRKWIAIAELEGKTLDEVVKIPKSVIYEMAKKQIRRDAEINAQIRKVNKNAKLFV